MIEILSKFIHEECWMVFANRIINSNEPFNDMIDRWNKDCMIPYEELSETEKEKDRVFARKLISLIAN